MCFSAEADFVAAIGVGIIGVDALRHVDRRAELPLATLPMLLASHQLIEGVVWLGLHDHVSVRLERIAVWLYLIIAFSILPVLVPVAVTALEPPPRRARMVWFASVGAVVSAVLTYAIVRGPVRASVDGHHVAYDVGLWRGGGVVALYVLATCGPLLVSSHRHIRWFGAANLVAVTLLAWLAREALVSLWCAWAAVTSIAIAVHLRYAKRAPRAEPARDVAVR